MPKGSALMTWLMSWAAGVIFRYKVHSPGCTRYERIIGRRCNQPVARFAENKHFKFTADRSHRHEINAAWSTRFFVGINGRSTGYLVASAESVSSCATIRRLPDDESYGLHHL